MTPCPASPTRITAPHLTGGNDGASRHWPHSTRRISEVRIRLEFERATGLRAGPAALIIDIVDYPGEWLLDLPLLDKTFAQWSKETLEASATAARATLAADWRAFTLADRTRQAPRTKSRRARPRRYSPPICKRAAPTPTRFPPCHPGAS